MSSMMSAAWIARAIAVAAILAAWFVQRLTHSREAFYVCLGVGAAAALFAALRSAFPGKQIRH